MSKLRIGSVVYDLVELKPDTPGEGLQRLGEDGGNRGRCNTNDLRIELDKSQPKDRKFTTLMHEIGHALIHEWAIPMTDEVEEKLITCLGFALAQVFHDNWKILERYKP